MKKLTGALLLSASIISISMADDTVETREITAFSQLNAGGNFNLVFTPSAEASIRFEGEVSDIHDIEIDVRGDELEIRQHGGIRRWFGNYRNLDVTVHVSGPDVTSFSLSRGIDANISGVSGDRLRFNVSTGADVSASGSCNALRLNTSTGSDFDGREMTCAEVRVNSSTGSSAVFNATDSLDANASTGSNVRTLTSPDSIRMNTSTGGNVRVSSR